MGNTKIRTRVEIRHSIESEHHYHAEALSSIRSDKTLSELGKRQQLGAEHQRHTTAIQALKVESDAADAAAQSAALKALFTLPHRYGESDADRRATQASYRQAVLHAAGLADERQARKAYELATITGDDLLAKAIALSAYQAGWLDIAEQYAADDPDRQTAYNELRALQAPMSASEKMARAMDFSAAPPADLGHVGGNPAVPPFASSPSPDGGNAGNGGNGGNGSSGNTGQ